METIVLILVLAITVEALIQYAKTIIKMLEDKQYKTFATQVAAISDRCLPQLCGGRGRVFPRRHFVRSLLAGDAAHRHCDFAQAQTIRVNTSSKRIQNPDYRRDCAGRCSGYR